MPTQLILPFLILIRDSITDINLIILISFGVQILKSNIKSLPVIILNTMYVILIDASRKKRFINTNFMYRTSNRIVKTKKKR